MGALCGELGPVVCDIAKSDAGAVYDSTLQGMMCTQERGCDVKELIVGNWIMWLV